jgi:hypothetical protein
MCFDSLGNPTVAAGVTASDIVVSAFMETVLGAANAAAARILLQVAYASVAEGKTGTSSVLTINPAVLAAVIQGGTMTYAVAAGVDTYTANLVPPITEYIEGAVYYIRFTSANLTTTPTLALNGLAAKTLKKDSEAVLNAGDIQANSRHALLYSNGYFLLMDAFKLVSGQVPDGLIVEAMLGVGSVTSTKLGAEAVDHAAMGMLAVQGENIAAETIPFDKLYYDLLPGTTTTLAISAAMKNTTSSYTKLKEIKILQSGTVTVVFDIFCTNANVYGRIYVNGVAVGTERMNTGDGTTVTQAAENITEVAGDLLQLYGKCASSNGTVGNIIVTVVDNRSQNILD